MELLSTKLNVDLTVERSKHRFLIIITMKEDNILGTPFAVIDQVIGHVPELSLGLNDSRTRDNREPFRF